MIDISEAFRPKRPKLLLVASNGGHLEQLNRFARSSNLSPDSLWITFDSAQARSLTEGQRVQLVDDVPTRDWKAALSAVSTFRRVLDNEHFDGVVSTGAAVALPAFIAARTKRVPTLYVESISRVDGPSLTGRLVTGFRLTTESWCQHQLWSDNRWSYHGSVLGSYQSVDRGPIDQPSLFVTLGTLKKYSFESLVSAVMATEAADHRTVWQLGSTSATALLPGTVSEFVTSLEFDRYALSSSTVVSHAGVGSVLRLLALGVYPVLVPRRRYRGEQVDDHQQQIARLMKHHDLAIVKEVNELTIEDFSLAARRRVILTPSDAEQEQ
jgi:UDP-N-acetylglucosamine--N-acetylmuramyl-(pentapeptide) pyrophosphoryl-undecaprenol N-acetylglucosamine transferase